MITRCSWCGTTDELYIDYHDNEWGVSVHDDRILFEFLILEWAQAGLSWITVLRKRGHYRKLFHDWDIAKISRMTDAELEHILLDPGIIRNRLKVYSVRKNAIAALQIQKEFGSLDAYFWNTPFAKVSSSPLLGDELERSRGRGYLVSEQNPQSLRDSSFAKELPNFPIVNHGSTIYDFPTESDISIAISKDLKKRGMSFVGSTIIYAYMQAIGMVDDHIDTCWKRVI